MPDVDLISIRITGAEMVSICEAWPQIEIDASTSEYCDGTIPEDDAADFVNWAESVGASFDLIPKV